MKKEDILDRLGRLQEKVYMDRHLPPEKSFKLYNKIGRLVNRISADDGSAIVEAENLFI